MRRRAGDSSAPRHHPLGRRPKCGRSRRRCCASPFSSPAPLLQCFSPPCFAAPCCVPRRATSAALATAAAAASQARVDGRGCCCVRRPPAPRFATVAPTILSPWPEQWPATPARSPRVHNSNVETSVWRGVRTAPASACGGGPARHPLAELSCTPSASASQMPRCVCCSRQIPTARGTEWVKQSRSWMSRTFARSSRIHSRMAARQRCWNFSRRRHSTQPLLRRSHV